MLAAPTEAVHVIHQHIAADHPAFAGHFPGMPVVPGVVLLDLAVRAAATCHTRPLDHVQVRAAKFLAPVGPDTALAWHLTTEARGGVRFEVRAGDRVVASGSLSFTTP